eukprot:9475905-Pyramimonas_sp.AAC.1
MAATVASARRAPRCVLNAAPFCSMWGLKRSRTLRACSADLAADQAPALAASSVKFFAPANGAAPL